jgi:hypothetical protein
VRRLDKSEFIFIETSKPFDNRRGEPKLGVEGYGGHCQTLFEHPIECRIGKITFPCPFKSVEEFQYRLINNLPPTELMLGLMQNIIMREPMIPVQTLRLTSNGPIGRILSMTGSLLFLGAGHRNIFGFPETINEKCNDLIGTDPCRDLHVLCPEQKCWIN